MRKELGDEQVRITVRLPRRLYDALLAVQRARYGGGLEPRVGVLLRHAIRHYVACPDRFRKEEADRGSSASQ
jgi:hypothetical protein